MGIAFECIVGLGNPGERYARTRHNAGWWLVDALAVQYQQRFRTIARCHGAICQVSIPSAGRVRLFKPNTHMNSSGRAVVAVAQYFDLDATQLLIVHDEIDLPVGSVRLKRGGGHGGHNGLRDIIAKLGSREFSRLRIGIGHPGSKNQVIDYVLQRADAEQQQATDTAINQALDEWSAIASGNLEAAMNALHQKPSP